MAIFHTYIDDSTPGGEDAVAGIGSDTLYGVFASQDFKVNGISTFSGSTEFEKVKFLKDSTGDIGNSGQILSSTGSGIDWINSNTTTVNAASNVGVNENDTNAEQWLTFVGAKSGNNPIRVDDDLRYNPSTNILSVPSITMSSHLDIDGNIRSVSGNLELQAVSGENGLIIKDDNAVELYFDGSSTYKLATTNIGVDVRGELESDNLKITGVGTITEVLNVGSGTSMITAYGGICTATTFDGALSGNADTATALETARTIGGTSFDGSANITPGVSGGLTGTPDIEVTDIDIAGALTDKNDITGSNGQVLTSTETGVAWANAGTLAAGAAAEVAVGNEATDTSCFPVFGTAATGSNIALKSNTGLKFDSDTAALEAGSFVKTGGTSSQFLKADGSVDTSTYLSSQVQSDWDASSGAAEILNKPTLFSGSYNDLTSKPTLVTAFTGLSDTPAAYTSQASKFVAVKSDGSGLEFVNNPNTDNQRGIDTTPTENESTESISSGWAYDHKESEGNSAHVPAAGTGNSGKFLANNGTWQTPSYTTNTNTTYGLHCTQDAAGSNSSDNDDPYLWLNASSGTDDSVKLVGGNHVVVTRDSDEQLTISSLPTSSVALSGTSTQTISTIALSSAYCSEFTVHITHSSSIQACKLLVMDDGSTPYCTEYAVMYSGSSLGSFSCTTSGSNILVQFTPANSGTTSIRFITQQVT